MKRKKRKQRKQRKSRKNSKQVTPQKGLKEVISSQGLVFSFHWKTNKYLIIASKGMLLIYLFIVIHGDFSRSEWIRFFFDPRGMTVNIFTIFCIYQALRFLFNKTIINVDQEKIETFIEPFPWLNEEISIPLQRVSKLLVVEYPLVQFVFGTTNFSYRVKCLVSVREEITLVENIPSYGQAQRIKQEIQRYLKNIK